MNKLARISRSFSSTTTFNVVTNVTVVGGGLMGSGIAQVAAQAGQNVTLIDLQPELLEKAQKSIQVNLTRVGRKIHNDDSSKVEVFVRESFDRIRVSTKVEDGVNADLIVEAIVEKLEVKQELFNKLDQLAPSHTILATNTSTISVNDIGAGVNRKDKYGGLHFFNPVPVMRLLEVVVGAGTSEQTHAAMMAWGKALGKTCITCKDTPGFVVNRLLGPYSAEALRMYERGDASARDIDTAMRLGAGYPMGPLELADFTGLDLKQHVLAILLKSTGDSVFKRIPLLDDLVEQGKFGRKTGEGIYKYKQ